MHFTSWKRMPAVYYGHGMRKIVPSPAPGTRYQASGIPSRDARWWSSQPSPGKFTVGSALQVVRASVLNKHSCYKVDFSGWEFSVVFCELSRTNQVRPTPLPAWRGCASRASQVAPPCLGLSEATRGSWQGPPRRKTPPAPWAAPRPGLCWHSPAVRPGQHSLCCGDARLAPGCGACTCLVGHQFILI